MGAITRRSLVVVALAACGARPPHGATPSTSDELTLYRDVALVSQHVDVDVPPASTTRVAVRVPPGLDVDQLVVLDPDEVTISNLTAAAIDPPEAADPEGAGSAEPPPAPRAPTEITFTAAAPRAGHFVVHLGYVTDALRWEAAYSMTTTPTRDRAVVRGGLAIRNETGLVFDHAHLFVVDAPLVASRGRLAEQLGSRLRGRSGSTLVAPAADLGRVTIGLGETLLPLLADAPPRTLRSVLVYDPIGTGLDHKGATPSREPSLGVSPAASHAIRESFEITRDPRTDRALPGGPVRLVEREPDGALTLLGEARMFDDATRAAAVETIALGTAAGVTGRRERRELEIDDDDARVVEEVVLTIKNQRPRPIEVVLREHLYRGETWALAYYSAPRAEKEGPQQISLRTRVPANSETKVLYVVVYSWAPMP